VEGTSGAEPSSGFDWKGISLTAKSTVRAMKSRRPADEPVPE